MRGGGGLAAARGCNAKQAAPLGFSVSQILPICLLFTQHLNIFSNLKLKHPLHFAVINNDSATLFSGKYKIIPLIIPLQN
jgi:hypothetical protein